jgi:hypothetical protein
MISSIIGLLNAVVAFVQLGMQIYRAFKGTTQDKIDKENKKQDEKEKHLDETGRPKWD